MASESVDAVLELLQSGYRSSDAINAVVGEAADLKLRVDKRNVHAVALGRLGASKGGAATALVRDDQERHRIATRAANRRWGKQRKAGR